jgi:4-amino-4-deoxychorismate lyase
VSVWINGRRGTKIDCRDRGLQYGDGVFESMRVRRGGVRLLDFHLDRLEAGCERLEIAVPVRRALQRELERAAKRRGEGVLKLIVTRGRGPRGYRPSGHERCTRILTAHALPAAASAAAPVRVRLCATPLGQNPRLAGLKTLNRLESVVARTEWRDARIWEGLMRDVDENIVCGTMSNLFMRSGSLLLTPALDRCGVAGVMRRWILQTAGQLRLRPLEGRIRWQDLSQAEEVFMSNAVVGLISVRSIQPGTAPPRGVRVLRPAHFETADRLRGLLESL